MHLLMVAIYDPTEKEPYGFVEIKCPYKHRSSSLSMACEDTNFCCRLTTVNGKKKIEIKRDTCIMHRCKDKWQLDVKHGVTLSCIRISNEVHIHRLHFNVNFWKNDLLLKLVYFYNNCLAQEIIHPMHVLGLPIRDISKEKTIVNSVNIFINC